LPIGLPEILKNAPREKLVSFYQKWYRPDQMAVVIVGDIPVAEAEKLVVAHFSGIPAAKGAVATVDTSVPAHKETQVNMSTDPEAQGWSVSVEFKHKADEDETVRGYRKTLSENLLSQMFNLRLRDIARKPNAPFLGANVGTSSIGRSLDLFELEAMVPEGKITEGLGALMTEAKRVQQYGFSNDELNRAKAGLLAGYERAYKERATSESSSYANEYVRHFLQKEPIPGMEVEYKIAATYFCRRSPETEISALAKELITEDNRVVLRASRRRS
jgi:zinc protease